MSDIKVWQSEIWEATTLPVEITCKDRNGENSDLSQYTIQTYIYNGSSGQYIQNSIVDNVIAFTIPAEFSLDKSKVVAETRIFKNEKVFQIFRFNVAIRKAMKPDIVPNE